MGQIISSHTIKKDENYVNDKNSARKCYNSWDTLIGQSKGCGKNIPSIALMDLNNPTNKMSDDYILHEI